MSRLLFVACLCWAAMAGKAIAANPPVQTYAPPTAVELAYWPRMPEPAAAMAAIEGRDAQDTRARRHAAATLLQLMAAWHGDASGRMPWPEADVKLYNGYATEQARAMAGVGGGPRGIQELSDASRRYRADPEFVRGTLGKFFTAADLKALEPRLARLHDATVASIKMQQTQRAQDAARDLAAQQQRARESARLAVGRDARIAEAAGVARSSFILFGTALALLAWTVWAFWRWLPESVIENSEPMQCRVGGRIFTLKPFRGVVRGATKGRSVQVHAQGGEVYADRYSVQSTPVTVTSTTTVHDQFFLELPSGRELEVQLSGLDIAVRDGHEMTALAAFSEGADSGPFVLFHNHHTGKSSFVPTALRSMVVPPAWWIGAAMATVMALTAYFVLRGRQVGVVELLVGGGIGLVVSVICVAPLFPLHKTLSFRRMKAFASQLEQQVVPRLA